MQRRRFIEICGTTAAVTVGELTALGCTVDPVFDWEEVVRAQRDKNEVEFQTKGDIRLVRSNGIPAHRTGQFPNRNNPSAIRAQSYTFEIPLRPEKSRRMQPAAGYWLGVALNGVVMDTGTAEVWQQGDPLQWRPRRRMFMGRPSRDGWRYEAISKTGNINLGLDANNGHVRPTGAYHYHGVPVGLVKAREKRGQPTLVGFAADGFPIYGPDGYAQADDAKSKLKNLEPSYRLKKGSRPKDKSSPGGKYDGTFTQDFEYVAESGDLDEFNGRFGVTKEYPEGTYYYVASLEFPFYPRVFRGTPDQSFSQHGGRGPGGPGGPGRQGGPGGRPSRGRGGFDPFGRG